MQRGEKKKGSYRHFGQRKQSPLNALTSEQQVKPQGEQENPAKKYKEPAEVKKRRNINWEHFLMFLTVVINGVLAWYTYQLYNEAIEQGKNSRQSAQAATDAVGEAKRANDHTIYKDSITEKRDREAGILQNLKDSNNLVLAQKSLRAQIGSIQETQKQFEVENAPYLQVINPKILPIGADRKLYITYHIENLRLYPVKMISKKNFWTLRPFKSLEDARELFPPKNVKTVTQTIEGYVIKEAPYFAKSTFPDKIPEVIEQQLFRGNLYLYAYTEIVYLNLANNKKRVYKCGIILKPLPNGQTFADFFHNENEDLSSK